MSQPSVARTWGPRAALIAAMSIAIIVMVMGSREFSALRLWDSTANVGSELFVATFYLMAAGLSLAMKRNRLLAWVLIAIVGIRLGLRVYHELTISRFVPDMGATFEKQSHWILEFAGMSLEMWLLLLMVPLKSWHRVIPIAAGCCATLHWIDSALVLAKIYPGIPHWAYSLLGILAAVGALATIYLIIRHPLKLHIPGEDVLPQTQLSCPRCGLTQQVRVGETLCAGCRLLIIVETEEGRCRKCHYRLRGTTGEACPECGETIPGRLR